MFRVCLFVTVYQDWFCIVSDVILFELLVCFTPNLGLS